MLMGPANHKASCPSLRACCGAERVGPSQCIPCGHCIHCSHLYSLQPLHPLYCIHCTESPLPIHCPPLPIHSLPTQSFHPITTLAAARALFLRSCMFLPDPALPCTRMVLQLPPAPAFLPLSPIHCRPGRDRLSTPWIAHHLAWLCAWLYHIQPPTRRVQRFKSMLRLYRTTFRPSAAEL